MTQAIDERYSSLAEQACCLSCGGAAGRIDAKPGEVCVDLGSGRGTDALALAEKVSPEGHVYGVDVAAGMVQKARRTAEKMGVRNITFVQCTLEHLDVPAAVADWVTSNCTINHASDKAAVWREIARILKRGGHFVVSDIYAISEVPVEYRTDPHAVAECWAGAVTKSEYLAQVEAAGLVDVTIVEESAPYEKGKISVASFTLSGRRPGATLCCARPSGCC